MALTDNLVAYWKMDEASGNPQDISGNGRHLTNVNTSAFETGKINNGTILNGTDQYHKRLNTDVGLLGDAFTVSAWFKLDTLPTGDNRMVVFESAVSTWSTGHLFQLAVYASGVAKIETWELTGNWLSITSSVTVSAGTWYHGVFVKESDSSWKIYIDTTMNNSTNTRDRYTTGIVGITLGASDIGVNGIYNYFDGMIDEVGVWDRALTAEEVSQLYVDGNGLQYPFTPTTAIKSINGLAYGSVKSKNGLAIASIKNINCLA